MERLIDPDSYLKGKIPEFVARGDFGLASGQQSGGGYTRLWFEELMPADEVAFEADVYLLLKPKAKALKTQPSPATSEEKIEQEQKPQTPEPSEEKPLPSAEKCTMRITGSIPPEIWNRLGTKLLPKLRTGSALRLGLDFTVDLDADQVAMIQIELRQVLQDLNLAEAVRIELQ
jgi:hypothetical protein